MTITGMVASASNSQAVEDHETVASWQSDVEQDQIRLGLADHADRRDAVPGKSRVVAGRPELEVEQPANVGVVLDDRDRSCHEAPSYDPVKEHARGRRTRSGRCSTRKISTST